ncbi:bola domain-containing protein [Hypoxylon sp. FL1284]|nr:bola domain-containing protein [Hypoxylon sp. FL1284]KAI0179727.1 bola domain-containing protein [Hypoxylon sp. FL1284]
MAEATATITEDSLRAVLTERLKAIHVEVTDMSGGCGQSFSSLIVSPEFEGQNSLKRHRAVNAALRSEIASIHAWSAKCQTPAEWERDKASAPPTAGLENGHVTGTTA